MAKLSHTQVPVLIGENYKHVMCEASIIEEGDTVTVTIAAKGSDASTLVALMTGGEPMALQFVAIPVTPHRPTKSKENM